MSRPIIVPLDGSKLAERALPYAAGLARALQTHVVLLYARWTAVLPDPGAPDLGTLSRQLRLDGAEVATHICQMPCVERAGQALLAAAADLDAGLIVMATHGRGGLGRWLYGSVADQVLRSTTLPLVLVPPACEGTWPEDRPPRVLATLDGSALAEEILDPLHDLLGPTGAELTLLRVTESIDFVHPHGDTCDVCRSARTRGEEPDIEPVRVRRYVEAVAAHIRGQGLPVAVRTEIGRPTSTIVRLAQELDVDLIAMSTHGRGGLARLVMGSVATETLRQARVPVLLVCPGAMRHAVPEAHEAALVAHAAQGPSKGATK
ncbi:MAG: universal stress protein [Chloroflexi bacterium]|nr:universal stress protein [Chloroflexota bacterium]